MIYIYIYIEYVEHVRRDTETKCVHDMDRIIVGKIVLINVCTRMHISIYVCMYVNTCTYIHGHA